MLPVAEVWAVLRALVLVGACWGVAEFGAWCRAREKATRYRSDRGR